MKRKTLDLVWARDQDACLVCYTRLQRGEGGYSVHHRRARGMGGSRDPVTDSPANLVLLCGSGTTGCHGRVERNREWALSVGLLVRQGHDPREVEITVHGQWWPILLGDDGRKAHVVHGLPMWDENPLVARG